MCDQAKINSFQGAINYFAANRNVLEGIVKLIYYSVRSVQWCFTFTDVHDILLISLQISLIENHLNEELCKRMSDFSMPEFSKQLLWVHFLSDRNICYVSLEID